MMADTVVISYGTYKTLQHDTWVNDVIIDYYLSYLREKKLNKEDASNVHICSTMFYKSMLTQPSGKNVKPDSFENNQNLSEAQKRHMRVKRWTKNIDLFSKDMIIVPICELGHWFQVIVIRPGLIVNAPDSEARSIQGEPFIFVLDSLGNEQEEAVTNIMEYLSLEWQAKVHTL